MENIVTVGPWRRFFAIGIDIFLLLTFCVILCMVFTPVRNLDLYFQTVNCYVGLIYFSFFESSRMQATPGEYILGIKITSLSFSRLSLLQAVGRHLCFMFPGIIMLLAIVPVLSVEALIVCILSHFLGINLDKVGDAYIVSIATIAIITLLSFVVASFYLLVARLCSKGRQSVPDYFSNTLMLLKQKTGSQ